MKLLLIICLLFSLSAFSQIKTTICDHNVSTDFDNPTNSALPAGAEANYYLNGFNWFPVTPGGLYDDYPCTNIHFAGVDYEEMNSILLYRITII
jgi:hypothetical protein